MVNLCRPACAIVLTLGAFTSLSSPAAALVVTPFMDPPETPRLGIGIRFEGDDILVDVNQEHALPALSNERVKTSLLLSLGGTLDLSNLDPGPLSPGVIGDPFLRAELVGTFQPYDSPLWVPSATVGFETRYSDGDFEPYVFLSVSPGISALSFVYGTLRYSPTGDGGDELSAVIEIRLIGRCFRQSQPFSSAPMADTSDSHSCSFTDAEVITTAGQIPEPASWAMMIAGFGLAGFRLRRRNPLPGR